MFTYVSNKVVDNLLRKANFEASSSSRGRPEAECVSETAGAPEEGYAEDDI